MIVTLTQTEISLVSTVLKFNAEVAREKMYPGSDEYATALEHIVAKLEPTTMVKQEAAIVEVAVVVIKDKKENKNL